MFEAIAKADSFQGLLRFPLICRAMKILGQHNVFERGKVRHQMKLLEYEANFLRTETRQPRFV
jgi:hypothetical protein